jgi:hypothetical protein
MGVTPRRGGFAALVLAAVLLPLRQPKPVAANQPVDDRSLRLASLLNREFEATYLYTAIELRDTALSVIARDNGETPIPRVFMVGFPRGAGEAGPQALAADLWKRIGPADSSVHTAIVVYNSDGYRSRHYQGTLTTQRNGRTWCIAIVSGSTTRTGGVQFGEHWLRQTLAPCTFLAAFGLPGAGVGSWLAATDDQAIQSDAWLTHPRGDTDRLGPWERWNGDDMRGFSTRPFLIRALGSLDFTSLLVPPYSMGATGLQCLVGEGHACVQAVLHPTIKPRGTSKFPPDLTVPSWLTIPDTVTVTTVRPAMPSLAAAMVTDHDRTRFRRFWKSDRPVELAFQDAFGESLGDWTARWAAREWQASFLAKYRGPQILLGVTLEPSWPFVVIAWTGAALLIASWVARRRTA